MSGQPEMIERVINIKRVSKVVKGGKRMKISSAVVVGDGKGLVGVGHGKAAEVAIAVRKASERAKKELARISLRGHTIAHTVIGKYGASKVIIKPASAGTGLVACPQVRAVLEACGIQDVLTKSLSSHNPYNLAVATIRALASLRTIEEMAAVRNKPIGYFIEKKTKADETA